MTKSIVQSERQRPRAVELMKALYASHVKDPTCGLGEGCPLMVDLKKRIEAEEASTGDNFSRPLGFK